MSELRRWSEEGATPAELSLLEVSRREQAPAKARARTLGALGLAVAVSTATSTAVATTSRSGVGLLLKVLGTSLLGGGLVVTGLAIHHAHLAATATTSAKRVRTAANTSVPVKIPTASASTDSIPLATSDPEAEVATAPAVASSASQRPTRPEAAAGRLSREVAALERAHHALAAQDPSAALHFLDRYRAEFPSGALGSEATVLRVQALLASGNRAAAQTLADSYSSAHPDSPYSRRIQAILHFAR